MNKLLNILKGKPKQTEPRYSMHAVSRGGGSGISYQGGGYYGTERICWVSRETDDGGAPLHTRKPNPSVKEYPSPGVFQAGGKTYTSRNQLTMVKDEDGTWCKDMYGRQVLCLRERFPCFDSYDFAHENRYYYWYFLRDGDRLTRIYYGDGSRKIIVTEDVEDLEYSRYRDLQELKFLD